MILVINVATHGTTEFCVLKMVNVLKNCSLVVTCDFNKKYVNGMESG